MEPKNKYKIVREILALLLNLMSATGVKKLGQCPVFRRVAATLNNQRSKEANPFSMLLQHWQLEHHHAEQNEATTN